MITTKSLRAVCAAVTVFGGALLTCAPADADDYAYMTTGLTSYQFGVVDLSTGAFSVCGTLPLQLAGLGVGPDHNLYSGEFTGTGFYRVNLTDGTLTTIGVSSISFFLQGSTLSGLYAVGTDGNLYTINYATGAASLVGALHITIDFNHTWGMSTNSRTLYMTENGTLFKINTATGRATEIGTAGTAIFGSEVTEHNILYAGNFNPSSIDSLDPKTGDATFVANLSGEAGNPWGLAPIREQSIGASRICKPHQIP
jgi:hypothetical protein